MNGNRLSLHHLCALDCTPGELVEIAGRLGCGHVTLFTHVPEAAAGFYPCVGPEDAADLVALCERFGVSVCNLEVFPLDRDGEPLRFEQGLAVGAALGATRATAHIHAVADEAAAVRRFAGFCDQAARHGIVPGLEFNAFSAVRDLAAAARIVRAAEQGRLVVDTLHFMRNGGDPAQLEDCADLVEYVQLSDGPPHIAPDQAFREAVRERMLPGTGSFPLAEIVRRLSGACIFEAEVPQAARAKAGDSALARAGDAVAALRALLPT